MALPPFSAELIERFRTDLAALAPSEGPIGVAVSGGPDSLALLLLTCAAFPGRVRAATVDHGLRPESADEARHVAAICAALGCPHVILTIAVPAGGAGLQGEARQARYDALSAWMAGAGIRTLLTGHQQDDQAETLLMRLQRGSGAAGLAGVRASRPFPGPDGEGRILRPLLGWRRAELAAIVRDADLEAVDDPSNADESFDRVRMRRQIGETPWLDVPAIARSAAALADAEEALTRTAQQWAMERVEEKDGAILFRPGGIPIEIIRRILLDCLRRIVPGAAPRGDQLTSLVEKLRDRETVTLAGVKCSGTEAGFRFEPAPPRRGG